jgi:gluconate kinase
MNGERGGGAMLIYLFGLPAAGKNYVGEVLAEEFGFTFYDGDHDLTPEMRQAVREQRSFTDPMRDRFYAALIARLAELRREHPFLAFGQATFKERHRRLIADAFPDVVFMLVEADEAVRMGRLAAGDNPVTPEYARRIAAFFEPPEHPHFVVHNNHGRQEVVRQLAALLDGLFLDGYL